jgi:hypothetical protein
MYIWRPGQLPIGQTAKARSGYRVQSLRKGRDRQCGTYPIQAATAVLVKIALPFFTAVGMKKGALCRTRELQVSGDGSAQEAGIAAFQRRGWSAQLTVIQCDQTTV